VWESTVLDYAPHKCLLNEIAIQQEIKSNSTVTANMQIYSSFYNFFHQYPDGVYDIMNHTDLLLGGHAVSVIGWGQTQDGVKYWLVRNTWGTRWGDQGCFRILRGTNCCHIEGDVTNSKLQYSIDLVTKILTESFLI
jgi:hypothetical protein